MEVLLGALLESYRVGTAGDIHLLIDFFINFQDVILWAVETWLKLLQGLDHKLLVLSVVPTVKLAFAITAVVLLDDFEMGSE